MSFFSSIGHAISSLPGATGSKADYILGGQTPFASPRAIYDAALTNKWGLGGGITGNQNSKTSWDVLGGGSSADYPGMRRFGRTFGTLVGGYSAGSGLYGMLAPYLGGGAAAGESGAGESFGLTGMEGGDTGAGESFGLTGNEGGSGGLSGFLSQYGQYGNLLSNVLNGGQQGSPYGGQQNPTDAPSRFQPQPYPSDDNLQMNLLGLLALTGQQQPTMSMPESSRISGGGLI